MAGVEPLITFLLVTTSLLQMALSCVANAILWFTILWQKLAHSSCVFPGGLVPRHSPSQIPKSVNAHFSSVQFSHSVMSDSLWPHGLQHARLPCPSPTPGVYSNSCPLSRWCHLIISSFIVPFSFCLQSFPASGSFQMSQLFTLGGQSIGVSASTSVLPVNIPDWFPLGWTGWISLQSKGLSRAFSNTTVQKNQFFGAQLSL